MYNKKNERFCVYLVVYRYRARGRAVDHDKGQPTVHNGTVCSTFRHLSSTALRLLANGYRCTYLRSCSMRSPCVNPSHNSGAVKSVILIDLLKWPVFLGLT